MITISDFFDDQVHCNRRSIMIGRFKLLWPWPMVYALHSSSAVVLGYSLYGGNKTPSLIKFLGKIFKNVFDIKYEFLYRFHPKYRYHIIDTGLGYGYHERDEQLLHAALVCLEGYVQDCKNTGCHDPGDIARKIMHWWKVQRPIDQAQYAKWMSELYSGKKIKTKPVVDQPLLHEIIFDPLSDDDEAKQKAMWALERKIHDDEQKYLHMLINIRPSMWT